MRVHGFGRSGDRIVAGFDPGEVEVLSSLVGQLVELLDDMPGADAALVDAGEDASPFARWEAEFATGPDQDAELADPVLRRLFPDAYPDDPQASAEFRRYSQDSQRLARIAAGQQVLRDLSSAKGEWVLADDHTTAWLTTLTATRLALAVRLGVDGTPEAAAELAGVPDDDPRGWLFGVYEWLGWVQETLLDCL